MKRRISLIAVCGIVCALCMAAWNVYAARNADVDLSGNWCMWLSTNNNNYFLLLSFNTDVNGYPLLVLKQDGNKLTGAMKGRFGELVAEGEVKGRDFELKGAMPQGDVTLKGKIEDGKLSGIIDMGIHGSGRFMMAKE